MTAADMDAEYQEGQCRDLVVEGAPEAVFALIAALKTVSTDRWHRDIDAEAWHAETNLPRDEDRPLVFASRPPCARRALLWLLPEHGSVYVANIVPSDGAGSLSPSEYNELIASFAEECLAPIVERVRGLRVLPGPEVRTLEDQLTPEAAALLRRFSVLANKATGNAHPMDRRRWNDFVVAAHEEGSALDWEFLHSWLQDDGWTEGRASTLADCFSDQLDILRHRAPVLPRPRTLDDWNSAVEWLRAVPAVVILDACAVLDLLQFPTRRDAEAAQRHTRAVSALLSAAGLSLPGLAFAVPSAVSDELVRNEGRVKQAVESEASRAAQMLHALRACERVLSPEGPAPAASAPEPDSVRALELLQSQMDTLRGSWTLLPLTDSVRRSAYERSSEGRPPATRGKDSIVDCAVVEVALLLARDLPAARSKLILLSSNTKDFSGATLQDELAKAGVIYCASWEHACHAVQGTTRP